MFDLQERLNQTETFEKERERYTREFNEARRIAQEMERRGEHKALDLDQGKEFSR